MVAYAGDRRVRWGSLPTAEGLAAALLLSLFRGFSRRLGGFRGSRFLGRRFLGRSFFGWRFFGWRFLGRCLRRCGLLSGHFRRCGLLSSSLLRWSLLRRHGRLGLRLLRGRRRCLHRRFLHWRRWRSRCLFGGGFGCGLFRRGGLGHRFLGRRFGCGWHCRGFRAHAKRRNYFDKHHLDFLIFLVAILGIFVVVEFGVEFRLLLVLVIGKEIFHLFFVLHNEFRTISH